MPCAACDEALAAEAQQRVDGGGGVDGVGVDGAVGGGRPQVVQARGAVVPAGEEEVGWEVAGGGGGGERGEGVDG